MGERLHDIEAADRQAEAAVEQVLLQIEPREGHLIAAEGVPHLEDVADVVGQVRSRRPVAFGIQHQAVGPGDPAKVEGERGGSVLRIGPALFSPPDRVGLDVGDVDASRRDPELDETITSAVPVAGCSGDGRIERFGETFEEKVIGVC